MGRFSLFMVMGLSVTLLFFGPNMKSHSDRAYENYLSYVTKNMVHHIAVSGANMAANQMFFDNTWTAGYSNVDLGPGQANVTVTNVGATNRKKILSVGHYSKGMTVNGNLTDLYDTVEVLLQPSSFSKFSVYINNMSGVAWATGDTVWGPCHIEGTMNLMGQPVFYGKVTTKNGTNPATLPSGSVHPHFYGSYQSGVSIPIPSSLSALQTAGTAGGKVFTPPGSPVGTYEVRVQMNSDGTVNYKEYKGATKLSDSTLALSTLAPNGVVLVNGGNMKIHGTLNGQATFGALGGSGVGNVYIDGDCLLAHDPVAGGGRLL